MEIVLHTCSEFYFNYCTLALTITVTTASTHCFDMHVVLNIVEVLYMNIVLYNFLTLPVESSREAAMSPLPYANQTLLDQVNFVGA